MVRRLRQAASFDDSKPMRRISYLRATNNEQDYHSDNSSVATNTSTSGVFLETNADISVECPEESYNDADSPDPLYDVVAEGEATSSSGQDVCEDVESSPSLENAILSDSASAANIAAASKPVYSAIATEMESALAAVAAVASSSVLSMAGANTSRRASVSSDVRNR